MSRRKKPRKQTEAQKQQQILQKVHVEIPVDYELLAKEILKQQELLEQAKKKGQDEKKEYTQDRINIFQAIYLVLTNKTDTEGRFLSGSMASLLSLFFRLIGYGLFLIAVLCLIAIVMSVVRESWNTVNQFFTNFYACLILFFSLLCLFFSEQY